MVTMPQALLLSNLWLWSWPQDQPAADVQTIHGKMKVTGLLSELNEFVLTSRH